MSKVVKISSSNGDRYDETGDGSGDDNRHSLRDGVRDEGVSWRKYG